MFQKKNSSGSIKGTSRDRLYQELGLEPLADWSWSCRLFLFHKIIQGLLPSYLQTWHNNAVSEEAYLTRLPTHKIKPIPARMKVFEN